MKPEFVIEITELKPDEKKIMMEIGSDMLAVLYRVKDPRLQYAILQELSSSFECMNQTVLCERCVKRIMEDKDGN